MKARTRSLVMVAMVALIGGLLCANGCKKTVSQAEAADSVALCTKCGQIKGTDVCCVADQVKCSSCGLVKGSPGCCNIPKDATTAALCTKCGQIKGSDVCCATGQTKCDSCGLVKGSPGCCKIPKP